MRLGAFIAVLLTSVAFGQSSEANLFFDNYDYVRAAEAFKQLQSERDLNQEEVQKMAYSYYVVGDYKACAEIIGQVTEQTDCPSFFYFVQGRVYSATGKFDEAQMAFDEFEKMEPKENVGLYKQSTEAMRGWSDMSYVLFENNEANTVMADHSGAFGNRTLVYQEYGLRSDGERLPIEEADWGELMLMAPWISSANGMQEITWENATPFESIQSLAPSGDQGQVLAILNRVFPEDEVNFSRRVIIDATLNPNTYALQNPQEIFTYFTDTMIVAQLAVNESGNMIVVSAMSPEAEKSDFYYSTKSGDNWSELKSLDAINTSQNELFPGFSGDTIFTFSSDGYVGYGDLDIYTSNISDGGFGEVKHLKSPVNSFRDDFNMVYESADSARFTSNRFGGKGDDDMYRIVFQRPLPPEPVEPVVIPEWDPITVFFDFDVYDKINEIERIDEIKEYLAQVGDAEIHLVGYADSRGKDEYNYELALMRVLKVKSHLMMMGIPENRIHGISRGESIARVECKDCDEQQHSENRAVEIDIKLMEDSE